MGRGGIPHSDETRDKDDDGNEEGFDVWNWESVALQIPSPQSGTTSLEYVNNLIDPRLVLVLRDLQELVAQINKHSAEAKCLDCSAFEPFHGHILHRLLLPKSGLDDAISECLRLGLLAFMVLTTIHIPKATIGKVKLYPYLTESLRNSCRIIESSSPRLNALVFWILTIGAMSVLDMDDDGWLVQKWSEVTKTLPGVRLAWEDARMHLESVLWIRNIHDTLGRQTYMQLIKRSDG
jgi:hypothetical protein